MRRTSACMLALWLLASCSAMRLSYNNADMFVRYTAHEYFDLDEAQNDRFRRRLARFHDWHRRTELPQYADLMKMAAQVAGKGASRDDIVRAAEMLRQRYRTLVARAAEEAAPILATLTPGQIEELEKRLARANEKFADEFLSGSQARQHRAQRRRLLGRFRDWLGSLSDEQEARIERTVKEHAPLVALRLEDRRRWQREAVVLIREQRDRKALGMALAALLADPQAGRAPEVAAALARREADIIDLTLDIERTLSAEQRAHAVRTMEGYARDFEALAADRTTVEAKANP